MATELIVKLLTIEPVMGGETKATQRENILAALMEPMEVLPTEPEDRRRALTRKMQDPELDLKEKAVVANELRALNRAERTEEAADGG